MTDIDAGTGATDDERIGDKVTISSLQCKLAIDKCQGDDHIRILVVQFKDLDDPQANLVMPEILQYGNVANNNPDGNDMDQILSPYKQSSTYKYRILYDRVLKPLNRKQINVAEQITPINATRMVNIKNSDLRAYDKVLSFLPGQNQQRPIQNGVYLYIYSTSNRLISTSGASKVFPIVRMKYRDA